MFLRCIRAKRGPLPESESSESKSVTRTPPSVSMLRKQQTEVGVGLDQHAQRLRQRSQGDPSSSFAVTGPPTMSSSDSPPPSAVASELSVTNRVVRGLSQMLRTHIQLALHSSEQKADEDDLQRRLEMVSDMFQVAQDAIMLAELGTLRLRISATTVSKWVDAHVQPILKSVFSIRNIQLLTKDVSDDILLRGDLVRLRRVLVCIVENAFLRGMARRVVIRIEVGKVKDIAARAGTTFGCLSDLDRDVLHMTISDDGIGMTPDVLSTCTDLFTSYARPQVWESASIMRACSSQPSCMGNSRSEAPSGGAGLVSRSPSRSTQLSILTRKARVSPEEDSHRPHLPIRQRRACPSPTAERPIGTRCTQHPNAPCWSWTIKTCFVK